MRNSNTKLYNFMLILLLFVHLKHHYFVSHLYLTEILFAFKLHFYFKFWLIKNPDLSALIFGLTELSFNKMLVTSIVTSLYTFSSIVFLHQIHFIFRFVLLKILQPFIPFSLRFLVLSSRNIGQIDL